MINQGEITPINETKETTVQIYKAIRDKEEIKAWLNPLKFALGGSIAGTVSVELFKAFGITEQDLHDWDIFKDGEFYASVMAASLAAITTSFIVLSLMTCVEEYWKSKKQAQVDWESMTAEQKKDFESFAGVNMKSYVKNMVTKFLPLGMILFSANNFTKTAINILLKNSASQFIQVSGNIGVAVSAALVFSGSAKLLGIWDSLPRAMIPQIFSVFFGFASSDPLVTFMQKYFNPASNFLKTMISVCVPPALACLSAATVASVISINNCATEKEDLKRIKEGTKPMSFKENVEYIGNRMLSPLEFLGRACFHFFRPGALQKNYEAIPDPAHNKEDENKIQPPKV